MQQDVGRVRFAAPYDAVIASVTIGFAVLLFGMALLLHSLLFFVPVVLLFVACFGWAPTGYVVEPDRLVVLRPFGRRSFPLADLRGIGSYEKCAHKHWPAWRVGGIFGAYGQFWHESHRWLYVGGRRVKPAIALTFADRMVVVMPDDPERFTAAIGAAKVRLTGLRQLRRG